jgi:hypothetical protein
VRKRGGAARGGIRIFSPDEGLDELPIDLDDERLAVVEGGRLDDVEGGRVAEVDGDGTGDDADGEERSTTSLTGSEVDLPIIPGTESSELLLAGLIGTGCAILCGRQEIQSAP